MEGYHNSVLLKEVINALNVRDAWYLDATLGDGGHSIEIISRGGRVIGFDVDPQALKRVQKRFENLGIGKDKYKLVLGNFRDLKNLIHKPASLAGAIFDLGVSSLQLETPERGFSFGKDGPLDMRMDPSLEVRALDLINILSRKELYELFKEYGEETNSWRLANALVLTRQVKPISNTLELAYLIERVVGRKKGFTKSSIGRHPATKGFQALRIAVNDELDALKEGLIQVKDLTEKNGHIIVISFHSLEDRIVKNTFKQWCDKGIGEILTEKPILPSDIEIAKNPRSRSAKLRIFKLL